MKNTENLDTLEAIARTTKKPGHGARLQKALLLLALPATAAFCTACYAAMPAGHAVTAPVTITDEAGEPLGYDCDGDGVVDATTAQQCPYDHNGKSKE